MELNRMAYDPLAAARGLRRRMGRVVRRLRDRAHLAFPSENGFLRDLGGRFGTIEEFLDAAARDDGRLFVAGIPRRLAAEFFSSGYAARQVRIVKTAEAACAHRFDLLGSGPTDLGARLPWHTDFKSGHVYDRGAYYEDLKSALTAEFGKGWDVKVPWELSRFQHLPALGQAFWLTGERRFYEEARAQILDWIRTNRTGFGVNWTCTMDVAIRAVNWIWAYGFFRPEILADREFGSLFLRSLFAHGRFIASNLENTGPVRSNHYLSDLVGLLFVGVLFRGAPEADVWKGSAIAEIVSEAESQTYPDGVDYEASIAYHRLKTEMYLTALILMERSGFRLPGLRDRVRSMVDFVAHYTRPDGTAPPIGDEDDGRLQILGEYDAERRDHRHLLAVAACAYAEPRLMGLAGERWEEAFWFFGERCVEMLRDAAVRTLSVVTGRLYPEAGIAVLRHKDLHAVLDAGQVGLNGFGAHAHNDTLSVVLQAAGRDLVVDPGVGAYTPDRVLRDRFRSTAAHSTVRVDGQEINPLPDRPFELPGVDAPRVVRFVSRGGFDLVEAEHRGYMRLADPVLHRRVLLLNKKERRFVIEDHLDGRDTHRIEWFFPLAPGAEAVLADAEQGARCRAGGVRFAIRPSLLPGGARAWIADALFSPSYGRVEPSLTVRYEWTGRLPVTVRFSVLLEDAESGATGGEGAS
jgi:hypothetical protein